MGSELRSAWACPSWAAAGGGGVERDWIRQLGLADRGQPATGPLVVPRVAFLIWGVPPSLAFRRADQLRLLQLQAGTSLAFFMENGRLSPFHS